MDKTHCSTLLFGWLLCAVLTTGCNRSAACFANDNETTSASSDAQDTSKSPATDKTDPATDTAPDKETDTNSETQTHGDSDQNVEVHISFIGGSKSTVHYATNKSGSWEIEDLGLVSDEVAMAVDANGYVHLVRDEIKNIMFTIGNHLSHVTNRSGSWTVREVATDGAFYHPAVALDSHGVVHTAFISGTIHRWDTHPMVSAMYANDRSGSFIAKTLNDFGITFYNDPYVLLAVDAFDHVHLVSGAKSYYDGLEHWTNATGQWVGESFDTDTDEVYSSSFVLDPLGQLHIGYIAEGDPHDELRYATNTGGQWSLSVIDETHDLRSGPSIALDALGNRHIVFGFRAPLPQGGETTRLGYAVGTGDNWVVESLEIDGWFDARVNGNAAIRIDEKDFVHIVHEAAEGKLGYLTNHNGQWADTILVEEPTSNASIWVR